MRQCIRCGKVRLPWRFATRFMGEYTAVSDVCKSCARDLGVAAAFSFPRDWPSVIADEIADEWSSVNWAPQPMNREGLRNVIAAAVRDAIRSCQAGKVKEQG